MNFRELKIYTERLAHNLVHDVGQILIPRSLIIEATHIRNTTTEELRHSVAKGYEEVRYIIHEHIITENVLHESNLFIEEARHELAVELEDTLYALKLIGDNNGAE